MGLDIKDLRKDQGNIIKLLYKVRAKQNVNKKLGGNWSHQKKNF